MRINVKGIHWTLAKLADGTQKIYWYAWRNGPRIRVNTARRNLSLRTTKRLHSARRPPKADCKV